MERKTDLRVIKTRNAIKKAFKEMLCEMEPSKITVKELSERALIHRKTFYLHYSTIDALFEDMLRESIESYNDVLLSLPPNHRLAEANKIMLDHIMSQEPYVERMFCFQEYDAIIDKLILEVVARDNSDSGMFEGYTPEEMSLINTYLCNSAIGIIRRWERDGKAVPVDRMLEIGTSMVTGGLNAVMRKETE